MIGAIRRSIARLLGLLVLVATMGRVEIDWTGSRAATRGRDLATVESENGSTEGVPEGVPATPEIADATKLSAEP
jgi:hypothetical protein